jgi:hypothetical protein
MKMAFRSIRVLLALLTAALVATEGQTPVLSGRTSPIRVLGR